MLEENEDSFRERYKIGSWILDEDVTNPIVLWTLGEFVPPGCWSGVWLTVRSGTTAVCRRLLHKSHEK